MNVDVGPLEKILKLLRLLLLFILILKKDLLVLKFWPIMTLLRKNWTEYRRNSEKKEKNILFRMETLFILNVKSANDYYVYVILYFRDAFYLYCCTLYYIRNLV